MHALGKNNFEHTYNLTKEVVKVVSADAGTKWTLANVLGHPIYSKDSRNFELFYGYDVLNRPTQAYLQGGDVTPSLAQTVKQIVYGESQDSTGKSYFTNPESLNFRGQAVIGLDEAGLSLAPSFTIHDHGLLQPDGSKSITKKKRTGIR